MIGSESIDRRARENGASEARMQEDAGAVDDLTVRGAQARGEKPSQAAHDAFPGGQPLGPGRVKVLGEEGGADFLQGGAQHPGQFGAGIPLREILDLTPLKGFFDLWKCLEQIFSHVTEVYL